jgi:hypothetical protein
VRLDNESATEPPKYLLGTFEHIQFSTFYIDLHHNRLMFVRENGIETAGRRIVDGSSELG